ncbi:hypothetical protein D3C86_1849070 [compost metagenome]
MISTENNQIGMFLIRIAPVAERVLDINSELKVFSSNSVEKLTAIASKITCCKTTASIAGHMNVR